MLKLPRHSMPQIMDPDAFAEWAQAQGVSAQFAYWPAVRLHPRQAVSIHRTLDMPDTVLNIPALVSADLRILDGNHRWRGHQIRGTAVPAYRLGLTFDAAIPFLFTYPNVQRSHRA